MCIKATTKFDQPNNRRFEGDLETVHEKAHKESTADLFAGGGVVIADGKEEKYKRNNASSKRGASLTNTPAH